MRLGRPREFDIDQALDRAMDVFWRKGYESASLPDLTAAMGINRPSLYAAFGNKEELFLKVLHRYVEKNEHGLQEALAQPTARAVVEHYLNQLVAEYEQADGPRGCLLVHGALACDEKAEPIKQALAARRNQSECRLKARFEQARDEGDLKADTDPAALARYVAVIGQGLAVQATSGATVDDLRGAVAIALRGLPF